MFEVHVPKGLRVQVPSCAPFKIWLAFLLVLQSSNLLADRKHDEMVLERGKVSQLGHFTGALLGSYPLPYLPLLASVNGGNAAHVPLCPVFGLAHILQGRYHERGWIFSALEGGLIMMTVLLAGNCVDAGENFGDRPSCGVAAVTFYGYLAVRGLEVLDLWVTPFLINAEYDE